MQVSTALSGSAGVKGVVSDETVVLRRLGSSTRKFLVLSTELIM